MKTNTRSHIFQIIQKTKQIRPADLLNKINISPVALHKHLAALFKEGKIIKNGSPPRVFYSPAPSQLKRSLLFDRLKSQKTLLRQFGVAKIGVFGSYARGEERKNSDIDLLVDFKPTSETFRNFIATTRLLESLLGRPVDIVTPKGISPYIRPYINRDISYVQISH